MMDGTTVDADDDMSVRPLLQSVLDRNFKHVGFLLGEQTSTCPLDSVTLSICDTRYATQSRCFADEVAKRMDAYPSATLWHHIVKHLVDKGCVHRVYTQSTDGVEIAMGLPVIQLNGRLTEAVCPQCVRSYEGNWLYEVITRSTRTGDTDEAGVRESKSEEPVSTSTFVPTCGLCGSVVRPEVGYINNEDRSKIDKDVQLLDCVIVVGVEKLLERSASLLRRLRPETVVYVIGTDAHSVKHFLTRKLHSNAPDPAIDAAAEKDDASDNGSDTEAEPGADIAAAVQASFDVAEKDWTDFIEGLIRRDHNELQTRPDSSIICFPEDIDHVAVGVTEMLGIDRAALSEPAIPSLTSNGVTAPTNAHVSESLALPMVEEPVPMLQELSADVQQHYSARVDEAGIGIFAQAMDDFKDVDDFLAGHR